MASQLAPLENCPGCRGAALAEDMRDCLCLGCMKKYRRCKLCYPTSAACSVNCRDNHKERLKLFFSENAPPLKGPPDPGPSPGSLL